MKFKRYITFKIETAQNMSKDKVVLLAHSENRVMLINILYKLQNDLENFKEED